MDGHVGTLSDVISISFSHTRASERRYRRTCSDADKSLWSRELQALRQLYEKKNCKYWRAQIAESKGNMKRLWRTLHDVLGEASNVELTAEEFAVSFKDKVKSVRVSTASTPLYDVPSKATPTLEQWTAVTSDEVVKLIGSSFCKSCQLDPAPTWFVRKMRELLSPFISLLFNKSQASGCYPSEFKKAVVRPQPRRQQDEELQARIESAVHVEAAGENRSESAADLPGRKRPDAKTQSAYRQYHSTDRDCRY